MAGATPDLRGKVAIVTGASRGIGAAAARALAGAGCDVVLASRDKAALQHLDGIPALIERAVADLGRLDILINNAGTNVRRPAVEFTAADWDTVVNLNL